MREWKACSCLPSLKSSKDVESFPTDLLTQHRPTRELYRERVERAQITRGWNLYWRGCKPPLDTGFVSSHQYHKLVELGWDHAFAFEVDEVWPDYPEDLVNHRCLIEPHTIAEIMLAVLGVCVCPPRFVSSNITFLIKQDRLMPGIDDFRKSVREMNDDELDSLLHNSRNNRSAPPKKKKTKTSSSKKKKKKKQDMDLSNITPEQAQALLDQLTSDE